jgi:hypothetical protein
MIEFNSFMEFTQAVEERDVDFVSKVANTVMKAIDDGEERVTIFSVPDIFGDEILSFVLKSNQYQQCLEKVLGDLIEVEMFEECAIIKYTLDNM